MRAAIAFLLWSLFICTGCASSSLKRTQQTPASRETDDFPIQLPGKPSVRMVLDREYEAITGGPPEQRDCTLYMLNPKDQQSGLVIGIGEECFDKTDADRAKAPGFTAITRESGEVAGQKVTWRRWSDANHLYSDCVLRLTPVDATESTKFRVKLFVIANTSSRRKTLEEHVASIQLALTSEEK
jgi:hypothetical protein